jgi:hypothetical protein
MNAFQKVWKKSKDFLNKKMNKVLEVVQIKDTPGPKEGIASWLSAEIFGRFVFQVQKHGEQLL